MDLKLAGRKALVTGGTRGIGRAIVGGLLAEGAEVAFCARDAGAVVTTEAELVAAGGRAIGSPVDVADGVALADWVATSASALGGIDVVVANVSAMASTDIEENWQKCFTIDLMHTVRMVNAALPHLERSTSGAIISVSSVSGREIDFFEGPYGAIKAALIHYTQGLAHRLAAKGIRANTVSPGNTMFEGGAWDNTRRDNPDLFAATLAMNPTGRLGTPEEMAAAVVFLASPVSSFTSGTNLVVDGALTRGVQL